MWPVKNKSAEELKQPEVAPPAQSPQKTDTKPLSLDRESKRSYWAAVAYRDNGMDGGQTNRYGHRLRNRKPNEQVCTRCGKSDGDIYVRHDWEGGEHKHKVVIIDRAFPLNFQESKLVVRPVCERCILRLRYLARKAGQDPRKLEFHHLDLTERLANDMMTRRTRDSHYLEMANGKSPSPTTADKPAQSGLIIVSQLQAVKPAQPPLPKPVPVYKTNGQQGTKIRDLFPQRIVASAN